MSDTRIWVAWTIVIALGAGLAGGGSLEAQQRPEVTKAQVDQWMQELSNWGRWGVDDQLGTLNLITPKVRIEAAKQVKEGISVSMAHNADKKLSIYIIWFELFI